MNPLPLDQRARKNGPKNRRALSGLEALDIDAAGQVKKLLFGNSPGAKGVRRFFRKDNEQSREIVLFDESFACLKEVLLPVSRRIRRDRSAGTLPRAR